uniref:cytochrome P450 4C1-like n=1 Tax=Achroia grisella TaxID=688607 RepID=UPI003AF32C46
MIIFTLSAIAVILCFIHVLLNYNKKALMLRKIPGPPETFILGNGPEIVLPSAELFKLARTYANRWDDIYRYWAFPYGAINIYNPEDIETIISTTRYNEKSAVYSFLKDWLKEGLLVSHGNKWHQRRKILTPAFHFNILREFCVTIEKNSQYLVNTLAKASGEMVDIIPILSEYTLSTICETAMGTQLNEISTSKGKSYKDAIYEIGRLITHRFVSVLLYADFMFNLSSFGRKQKKLLNIIHNFTAEIIKDREEYINKNGVQSYDVNDNSVFEDDMFLNKKRKKRAMLDSIILAKKDGLIDDAGIQEEVDTFMFAGHDTTAAGLTFFIMLLANNPTIQDKIYKELKEVFGGSTRHADIDDLSKLKYLDNCIKESLRLYPPAHFISRQLNETVKLGNYTVPSGVMCHIHIYDLHRRADLFPNPLEFDPDRFLPENSIGRHPYAYIPFSAGPRNCIGQKFAMIQMKSTISTLLRHYEFFPVTKPSDLQLKSDIVLRNSDPVYVKFVNRNK